MELFAGMDDLHKSIILLLGLYYTGCVAYADAGATQPDISAQVHKQLAKATNTRTWKLLEKNTLTEDETDEIVYTAYTSLYHWKQAGTLVNRQRAEWLIARVYAKLGEGKLAAQHARKCLDLTQSDNTQFRDFDIAYAYEAMARAHAVLGDTNTATQFYRRALDAGKKIKNPKDRELFSSDLAAGNWNGFTHP